MARADLLKKLFSSFKIEDREAFLRVAEEIIEDERKKNHGILANELKTIISTGTSFPKRSLSAFSASESKTKDHDETLFEIRYPEKTLSDVVLTSENRQQIEQIIREFLNWDVLMSNGVYPTRRVLFYGPPGTGKTFIAKAVATECRRTFFNVTSATITSRFLGESEKLVAHLFDLAEQMAPSTIFFDEIDSIASQRGQGNEHEASRKMKAQLLTRLEGIDGALDNSGIFVLAATNFPWHLDEALLRRFQKRIYIPLPDVEGRKQILKMNISDLIDDDFELDMFAERLEGYSCADIANLCRDAAQAVFDKQTSNLDTEAWLNMPIEQARVVITNQDFEKAMAKRKSSVDQATLKMYEEWRRSKGAE